MNEANEKQDDCTLASKGPLVPVRFLTITEHNDGQRIDNFLLRELKTLPKSHIYRILRKGEVRVNKKRAKAQQRLLVGDLVRIPPLFIETPATFTPPVKQLEAIATMVLFEDENLVVINKASGISVHGGSGDRFGVIELYRAYRPELSFIELVHRLDKETSGLLLLAKNRLTLSALHLLLKDGGMEKHYQSLVLGHWQRGVEKVELNLSPSEGGRGKMKVSEEGKASVSIFKPLQYYKGATLMDVRILTGRMHQIRTQLAHLQHPVLGDKRYGNFDKNRFFDREYGLKRLYLHAAEISFYLEHADQHYHFKAPVPTELQKVLTQLESIR